jgi:hypothetical protein
MDGCPCSRQCWTSRLKPACLPSGHRTDLRTVSNVGPSSTVLVVDEGCDSHRPPFVTATDCWLLYQRLGLASPQTVGFGFSGVVSGLVGVLAASTIGVVADWYGRWSGVYVAVALAGSCNTGILVSAGEPVSTLSVLLLSSGLVVAGVAGIVRQWRFATIEIPQQTPRDRLWVIGICLLVSWILTVALLQMETGIESRFVDVVAHTTGLLTGIGLTTLCGIR